MARWKWHLTRGEQPYPPDAIGAATDHPGPGRSGAHSGDLLHRLNAGGPDATWLPVRCQWLRCGRVIELHDARWVHPWPSVDHPAQPPEE